MTGRFGRGVVVALHGRGIVPGVAEGEALVSSETISGWGGIDPAQGVVIERRHPLFGISFAGKILVFPGAKGSSGWSGFFQATRLNGVAPLGMVFTTVTTKVALGAVVTRVPSVTDLDQDPLEVVRTGDWVRVDADRGVVEVTPADARPPYDPTKEPRHA
ncbi:MAG: aconitase X swivel domain-containing protein [Actinomycetes bacterium]